jgi:hypothetical protein
MFGELFPSFQTFFASFFVDDLFIVLLAAIVAAFFGG